MRKPFYARFLTARELRTVRGANRGGTPNFHAAGVACAQNPNCLAITEKAGPCGADCDTPGRGPQHPV